MVKACACNCAAFVIYNEFLGKAMSHICLPANHYFYVITEKVKKICKPLFENDRISFFDYGRFGRQGDFYGLSMNGDSYRIFFELEYESLKFCKNFAFQEDQFYYLFLPKKHSDETYSHALNEVYKILGADHGFSIIQKTKDYIDTFYFSSPLPHEIAMNYYFNQLPMLRQFISYFQKETSILRKVSHENSIILPKKMRPDLWGEPEINFSKTDILINKENSLTKREKECAKYICKGYTLKEIAALLNLSSRTVETHINNIKIKFNMRKKSDLIKFILTNQDVSL